jgi:hypothetical protein
MRRAVRSWTCSAAVNPRADIEVALAALGRGHRSAAASAAGPRPGPASSARR